MKKRKILALIVYIVPLILMCVLQAAGVTARAENAVSDALYQSAGIVSPEIYVIGVDEETLSEYGKFETWSRTKTAELIDLLCSDEKSKPAVIAVDIGFYGETENDAALVEAVKNAGNVVLVSTATFGDLIIESDGGFEVRSEVVLYEEPFGALKDAAAAVGHSNVELDDDGIVRHALGDIVSGGKRYPSFAEKIYEVYKKSESAIGRSKLYINYTGKPRDYFGAGTVGCSMCRVLDGSYNKSAFRGAIVIIGAYASGMQDNYYTSIDKSEQMFGVEIHANILNQLIDGVKKREISPALSVTVTLLLGAIAAALMIFVDTKISVPVSVALAVGYVGAAKLIYSGGDTLLPVLMPPLAVAILCISHIFVRYFTVHREKKRIISSYGKYLSPEVAATIADTGEEVLKLGGTKKDIAVLFVDIRGFTTLSESLPPEKVVEMLNSYLAVTTSAIFNNKGTVDKFIGDATMGVFNAPLDLDDYTYRAVCAGLEMAENAKVFSENLSDDLKGRVGFGVGINCGEAVVGNIGTSFRMEYTAIGDTVNTASRLEGQAKAGCVVISDAVYQRVKDRIECEDMGTCKLKGKAEEVKIYRAVKKK